MKTIFFLTFIGLFLMSFVTQAQTETPRTEPPVKISDKLYKIDLDKPADCIQKIIYQKTGIDVESELIDNGNTILIKNYHEGNGIIVTLLLKNGEQKQFVRSPCSMQVLTPL